MNLSDMKALLELYVDDIVPVETAVLLLNNGQNKMAAEVKAKFPQLPQDLTSTFTFDAKYHETPVLYAAAMIKSQDSSIREKESYLAQFNGALSEFSEGYILTPRYRDDDITQQFTATAGQTEFTITRNTYDTRYGDLKVFVNDLELDSSAYKVDPKAKKFTLVTAAALNDAVTALWEQHAEFTDAPAYWPGW